VPLRKPWRTFDAKEKNMNRINSGLVLLAALMAIAMVGPGAASATEMYSGATTLGAGTTVQLSLTGTASFTTTGGTVLDTCTGGGITGKTSNSGGAGVPVSGSIAASGLTFSGCTKTTDTLEGCGFEWEHISGTLNWTVWWKGCKVTIEMVSEFGGTCSYTAGSRTHLGTFKGVTVAGVLATWAIRAALIAAAGNSFLCPSDVLWVANYSATSPKPLHATNS
jgi:hypothetical protein